MLISNAITALSVLSLASAAALPDVNIEERAASNLNAGFKAKGKKYVDRKVLNSTRASLIPLQILGHCYGPGYSRQG
jgi:hypothetical protein